MPATTGNPSLDSDALAVRVRAHLAAHQDRLVDRSIEIAKSNGYAPFTTTIRAAWLEAILSVTEAVGDYLAAVTGRPAGPEADYDYSAHPVMGRMRAIARHHRSLGITLPMYLGLFKHFRNIYADALDGIALPAVARAEVVARTRDFFDAAELSIIADWTQSNDNRRLREMQERTRALTLEKDRYFAIFESMRSPAFLLDRRNRLVNANQAAAELFLGDAHAGDIAYLRSMRHRKSALQRTLAQMAERAAGPDEPQRIETLAGPRWFDVRTRVLHDALENIALGQVLLLYDVTEHREAVEKAQRAERQMSRFLATMSHEIRTPLHSVLGATDLLRTADGAARDTYLDVIESAGQTLLQTLNNVLDYSKTEVGLPVPNRVATDLVRALEAFRQVATVGRDRRRARVTVTVAPEVPARVMIDWAMTRQVLANLVSNAIRVDDGQGVGVRLTARQMAPGQATLRFEVDDHGPGLPDRDARALFQPFDRTEPRDTGGGGAGLGLAIAHLLVDAMHGEIGYENRPGGALLWFEMPVTVARPARDARPAPGGAPAAAPEGGARCLVVDDDGAGALVTTRQLEDLGYRVDRVSGVAEALEATARRPYDLMLVDYLLPDGDGQALARSLRGRDACPGRIVALTANVEMLENAGDAARLFDAALAKPAGRSALEDAIRGTAPRTAPPAQPAASVLADLSPETVRAMTASFAEQWETFLRALRAARGGGADGDLGELAHRLAGSTALLELRELVAPLRELERRCAAGADGEAIADLARTLDRDLADLPSWRALQRGAG